MPSPPLKLGELITPVDAELIRKEVCARGMRRLFFLSLQQVLNDMPAIETVYLGPSPNAAGFFVDLMPDDAVATPGSPYLPQEDPSLRDITRIFHATWRRTELCDQTRIGDALRPIFDVGYLDGSIAMSRDLALLACQVCLVSSDFVFTLSSMVELEARLLAKCTPKIESPPRASPPRL